MKKDLTFSFHSKKDPALKVQDIILEGDLSVGNVEAIKAKLQAVEFKYDVNLKLVNIETLDLAFIQLVYSLIKTLVAKGLKVTIKSDFSEKLAETINNTGFVNLIKT